MARNRTPTAILDAKGAFIANPQREREAEAQGQRPLGAPPKYLTPDEKKVWKRLAKELLPGVAFESDRTMFAELVVLTHVFESREPMKAAERSLRLSLAARFAMTPSDRSKVSVEKPKEGGLAAFLNRRKQKPQSAEQPEPTPVALPTESVQ